jgi:hypothetical protein
MESIADIVHVIDNAMNQGDALVPSHVCWANHAVSLIAG